MLLLCTFNFTVFFLLLSVIGRIIYLTELLILAKTKLLSEMNPPLFLYWHTFSLVLKHQRFMRQNDLMDIKMDFFAAALTSYPAVHTLFLSKQCASHSSSPFYCLHFAHYMMLTALWWSTILRGFCPSVTTCILL